MLRDFIELGLSALGCLGNTALGQMLSCLVSVHQTRTIKGQDARIQKLESRLSESWEAWKKNSGPDQALDVAGSAQGLARKVKLESGVRRSQETLGS